MAQKFKKTDLTHFKLIRLNQSNLTQLTGFDENNWVGIFETKTTCKMVPKSLGSEIDWLLLFQYQLQGRLCGPG